MSATQGRSQASSHRSPQGGGTPVSLLRRALWLLLRGVVFFLLAGLAAVWAPDQAVEALAVRWAQPPSQFLAIDGLQVHLRDEGPRDDPVPLVLLHGTSDSLHIWDGWTAVLAQRRRVIRFDLAGFGLTKSCVQRNALKGEIRRGMWLSRARKPHPHPIPSNRKRRACAIFP